MPNPGHGRRVRGDTGELAPGRGARPPHRFLERGAPSAGVWSGVGAGVCQVGRGGERWCAFSIPLCPPGRGLQRFLRAWRGLPATVARRQLPRTSQERRGDARRPPALAGRPHLQPLVRNVPPALPEPPRRPRARVEPGGPRPSRACCGAGWLFSLGICALEGRGRRERVSRRCWYFWAPWRCGWGVEDSQGVIMRRGLGKPGASGRQAALGVGSKRNEIALAVVCKGEQQRTLMLTDEYGSLRCPPSSLCRRITVAVLLLLFSWVAP